MTQNIQGAPQGAPSNAAQAAIANPYAGMAVPEDDLPAAPQAAIANPYAGLAVPEDAPSSSSNPMANKSAWEKGKEALEYGASQRLKGYAATLRVAGATDTAKSLSNAAANIAPDNYVPAGQGFFHPKPQDAGVGGYGWGYLPRTMAESAPGMAADLGVGAATGGLGFVGSNVAANYGSDLDERMANQPKGAKPGLSDYGAAGASAAAQAALSRLGLKAPLGSVATGAGLGAIPSTVGKVITSGADMGLTSAASDTVDQVASTAGTQQGLSFDPKEALNEGVMGAATGGALRAARLPGDVLQAAKASGFDPDSAARVAGHFDDVAVQPDTLKNGYKAVNLVQAKVDSSLDQAKSDGSAFLKATPGASDLVNDVQGQLKQGVQITPDQMAALQSTLGSHQEGQAIINSLQDQATLSKLKSQGNYDPKSQTFGSGAASWAVDKAKSLSGLGHGGVGFALAEAAMDGHLPSVEHLVGLAPMVGKAGATAIGAYGALRTLDAITQNRNTADQFQQRFSPSNSNPGLVQGALQKLGILQASPQSNASVSGANSPQAGGVANPQSGAAPNSGLAAPQVGTSANPGNSSVVGGPGPVSGPSGSSVASVSGALPSYNQGMAAKAAATADYLKQYSQAQTDNKAVDAKYAQDYRTGTAENKARDAAQAQAYATATKAQKAQAAKDYLGSISKDASGPSAATFNPSTNTMKVSTRGYDVERPMDTVRNPESYVAATKARMNTRADLGDDLKSAAGPEKAPAVEGLINRLNLQAHSFEEARAHFENFRDHVLPPNLRAEATQVWLRNQGKIMGTYKN